MTYDYWHAALRGEFMEVHDGHPQPGFYRKRDSRGGTYSPVAIWEQDGTMMALLNGRETNADDLWTYCCTAPVTEAQYRSRIETGRWWDEDSAVGASLAHDASTNNPPTDPREILDGQIKAALAGVSDYEQITSDETASKAQSLRSRLLELSGDADKKRAKLKAPHLEAGKAVDEAWGPLVRDAKGGADALRTAISAHETRQLKARQAEEAERQRLAQEAEKARQAALDAGKPVPKPVEIPPAPAPEPVSTQVRGAYGKAASKKVVKVASVSDQDALYPFLKTHKELVELMAKLAQRAVDAGLNPPGVTVEEKVDVR